MTFTDLRIRAGFDTNRDFAKHIGKSVRAVERWSSGAVPVPKIVTLYLELKISRN